MARYSPRDPGFTRVPGVLDALSHIATSGAAGYTGVNEANRARELEDEERAAARETRETGLFRQGFRRGTAPTEPVPEDEDVFRDMPIGMQRERTEHEPPSIFRGARPGMAARTPPPLDRALGSLELQEPPPAPRMLALPGAYVEGMGFTDRAITDQDLVQESRRRNAVPRQRTRQGFEQVTDDLYFDPSASPEGREASMESARDLDRRRRLERALGAVQGGGDMDPALQAELLDLDVPASQVFPDRDANLISVGGRDFPNTPGGERAALAWQEALAEARSTGSGSGSGSDARITGEVTRRTLATAAARAVSSLDEEIREVRGSSGTTLTDRQRNQLTTLNRARDDALRSFGFQTIQELQTEMRALRLSGVGGGEGGAPPAGGGGGDLDDAAIDRILLENPDLTDEQVLDLLESGR